MCSSETSIFNNFPPPPGDGETTEFEKFGELTTVRGSSHSKLPGYPEITITRETARSLTQRENAKSAFLPHDETVSKRAYHAWYEMGMSGALEEIVNSNEEVPSWLCSTSQKLLVLVRWANSLHGSFFPHLALSNEDIISKFSKIVDWGSSPVKAFAWHPHTTKFAYALQDDTIRIHTSRNELVPTLKHKLQKNVADLAWQPHSSSVLAVACQSCILIWHVEPTSLATRPSSSSVQVLQQASHSPVTCLCWNEDGKILMSASPVDTAMMAWDVPMETCVPLRRFGGGGVSLLSWSPEGSKIFAATPSSLFRVWESTRWTCEKWSTSTGRVKAACWSPSGDVVLFATENEPIIYSLTFSNTSEDTRAFIGGSQTAVACVDLSAMDLETESESHVRVGGCVHHMLWDPTGERLAVLFKGTNSKFNRYIAVFRTKVSPVLEITPCGFIKGEDGINGSDGEYPQHMSFQPRFDGGALLTVVWSSGRVGYVPMYFVPSAESAYYKFQQKPTVVSRLDASALFSPMS